MSCPRGCFSLPRSCPVPRGSTPACTRWGSDSSAHGLPHTPHHPDLAPCLFMLLALGPQPGGLPDPSLALSVPSWSGHLLGGCGASAWPPCRLGPAAQPASRLKPEGCQQQLARPSLPGFLTQRLWSSLSPTPHLPAQHSNLWGPPGTGCVGTRSALCGAALPPTHTQLPVSQAFVPHPHRSCRSDGGAPFAWLPGRHKAFCCFPLHPQQPSSRTITE